MSETPRTRRTLDRGSTDPNVTPNYRPKRPAVTAKSRNLYFDTLRALALFRVLVFHLFGWAWLPLLFPSLGIMFALAGSLMAASLDRSQNATAVLRRRLHRLLPPLWAMGAILVPVMFFVGWTANDPGTQSPGLSLLAWIFPLTEPPASDVGYEWTLPLWYLRTYLWLVLLSPALLWLWRHFPKVMMTLPLLGLLLYSGGFLQVQSQFGSGLVSLLTFVTCWMLGFAHHDGMLQQIRMRSVFLIGMLLCLAGVWWAWRNPLPEPGFNLGDIPLAAAFYNLGYAALLMRLPLTGSTLSRVPPLRFLVDSVNQRAITIYIWGNFAIFLCFELMDRLDLYSFLSRSLWGLTSLGITLLVLTAIVLAVGWVEDLAARRPLRLVPESLGHQPPIPRPPTAVSTGPRRALEEPRTRTSRPAGKNRVVKFVVLAVVMSSLVALAVLMPSLVPRTNQFVRCVPPAALIGDLHSNPRMRDVAQMMVGSAENSSLYWEDNVGFLQYNVEGSDEWNRGYTGGIIGFTSRTSSMLELVRRYDALEPDNPLSPFLPALEAVNGTSSIKGLGAGYEQAWEEAAADPRFLKAQLGLAWDWYLEPALQQAAADGLHAFGQFVYYDAMIHHGISGFETIHQDAEGVALPPTEGGEETEWLQAWLDAREVYMTQEVSEITATRVTTAQQGLLDAGELQLRAPLEWEIYGDHFRIQVAPFCSLR